MNEIQEWQSLIKQALDETREIQENCSILLSSHMELLKAAQEAHSLLYKLDQRDSVEAKALRQAIAHATEANL